VELPEVAGIYDDLSSDFVLLPSRVEAPLRARAGSTLRLRAAHFDRVPGLIIVASSFAAPPIANETPFRLALLTDQKK
jgi:hypothetical protein